MNVEIISPEKTITLDNAKSIFLPGAAGKLEVLENHAPAIVLLEKGNIKIELDNPMNILLLNRGYAHIAKGKTTIIIEDF
jgi:F-type H+-transporting ATPase subunit epsilon